MVDFKTVKVQNTTGLHMKRLSWYLIIKKCQNCLITETIRVLTCPLVWQITVEIRNQIFVFYIVFVTQTILILLDNDYLKYQPSESNKISLLHADTKKFRWHLTLHPLTACCVMQRLGNPTRRVLPYIDRYVPLYMYVPLWRVWFSSSLL